MGTSYVVLKNHNPMWEKFRCALQIKKVAALSCCDFFFWWSFLQYSAEIGRLNVIEPLTKHTWSRAQHKPRFTLLCLTRVRNYASVLFPWKNARPRYKICRHRGPVWISFMRHVNAFKFSHTIFTFQVHRLQKKIQLFSLYQADFLECVWVQQDCLRSHGKNSPFWNQQTFVCLELT